MGRSRKRERRKEKASSREKNELLLLLSPDRSKGRAKLTSGSVGVEDGGLYWGDGDGSGVELDGGCEVLFGEEGVSSRFEEVGESGTIFGGHGEDFGS